MSQSKNKNCSELLLTKGMGLDRAPNEILTFIFSPLEVKPPSVVGIFVHLSATMYPVPGYPSQMGDNCARCSGIGISNSSLANNLYLYINKFQVSSLFIDQSINLLTMESLRRGGQQAALSLGFTLWTPRQSGDNCDRCAGIGICIPSYQVDWSPLFRLFLYPLMIRHLGVRRGAQATSPKN